MDEKNLTHLNDAGEVRMVDVGDKPATRRTAVAEGVVAMPADLAARFFAVTSPRETPPPWCGSPGSWGPRRHRS